MPDFLKRRSSGRSGRSTSGFSLDNLGDVVDFGSNSRRQERVPRNEQGGQDGGETVRGFGKVLEGVVDATGVGSEAGGLVGVASDVIVADTRDGQMGNEPAKAEREVLSRASGGKITTREDIANDVFGPGGLVNTGSGAAQTYLRRELINILEGRAPTRKEFARFCDDLLREQLPDVERLTRNLDTDDPDVMVDLVLDNVDLGEHEADFRKAAKKAGVEIRKRTADEGRGKPGEQRGPAPNEVPEPEARPQFDDEALRKADPWALLASGKRAEAERAFELRGALDSDGGSRVRGMLRSSDVGDVTTALRIIRFTEYTGATVQIRGLTRHSAAPVRAEAARALGAVAGPSMSTYVEDLLRDSDPNVRNAAQEALAQMNG